MRTFVLATAIVALLSGCAAFGNGGNGDNGGFFRQGFLERPGTTDSYYEHHEFWPPVDLNSAFPPQRMVN